MSKDNEIPTEAKQVLADVISAVAQAAAAPGATVRTIQAAAVVALKKHLNGHPMLAMAVSILGNALGVLIHAVGTKTAKAG